MKDYFSLYFIIEDKKSIKSRLVSWDKCLVSPLMASTCLVSPLMASTCLVTPLMASTCLVTPLMASTCLVTPLMASTCRVDGYNYVNKFDYLKLSTIYVALLNWVILSTDCVSYFRLK